MNTSNSPRAEYDSRPPGNPKNVIIVILGIAFLGMLGYLVINNNRAANVIEQNHTQIAKITDEKSDIRRTFDASLARLDSMSGVSIGLKSKLTDKNIEIAKQKAGIRNILNKKNATAAELTRAKGMIVDLNDKISSMEAEVASLTQDNRSLTQDKVVLTADKEKLTDDLSATTIVKQDLEKKVDIASTLNASNIAITPVNGKEKVTTTAKRVSKLLISFDVNNRITQPGATDVFVCIIGPDGKNIVGQSLGSGTFTTREEGDKSFTAKLPVDLDSAKTKNVRFAFAPGANFQQGIYTIQIYQNGFKIGEGIRELKKGGLFS